MWFLGREMLSVGARQGAGPDVILGAVRGKWIVGGKDISREAGWETRVGGDQGFRCQEAAGARCSRPPPRC